MKTPVYLMVLLAFFIVLPLNAQNDSIDSYSVNDTLADFG
jgi:hypothetical protein